MDHVGDDVPITELLDERRHLLEVASWMLGSRVAAEGAINDAYRRWYGLSDPERAEVTVPRAWLTRTVGGICLGRFAGPDGAGSAPHVGVPSSPEPAGEAGTAPRTGAGTIGRSEPGYADPLDRARLSLRARRAEPAPPHRQDRIVGMVRRACAEEDAGRLASLLAPDASVFYDGGGRIRTLTRPVNGGAEVAHSLLTLLTRQPRTTLDTHSVNGRTGLVARYDDRVVAVITLDIAGSRVVQVWVMLNPDKLRAWNRTPA
ncbi:RNA polymerase sigma-70 factor (ECF subfamily) [Streptomyces sp. 840.1]|uniref:RNA polymerase subunit sigma n=1 Tax=Streptomyces sp. 840.1 TaxID=2485152 RepID=UPI000F4862F3|nr:RNA polymerase subunit sigma [Streptomyces sp. 840.1]ROQ60161.1 RNA polymerase sigma-70 factor (ECF subfamily) [Streptomyces sp. 840.1]